MATTSRMRLATIGIAVGLLVLGVSHSRAQDDTWRDEYPRWYEVVEPPWEETPGTNTYWHDPRLGWRNEAACWWFGPADAGCPPLWFGHVDGLFYFRDENGGKLMATVGPSGTEVLKTSDFRSEFSGNVRATIGRSIGDWYRVEATYFGTMTWSDQRAVRNTDTNGGGGSGNLYSPFSNFGDPAAVVGLDYNDLASIEFTSELTNVELNVRRRMLAKPGYWEASGLVGARYVHLGESFGYLTTSTTPGPATSSNTYRIDARNRLVGVQLGFLMQFLVRPRAWINFEAKGAIMANRASVSYSLRRVDNVGTETNYAGSDRRDRTSFLGELSLEYNYHFAPRWTFRAGYSALWLTGVALGSGNFVSDINLLQLGPAQVDHSGSVVFHGPHIGLTLAY